MKNQYSITINDSSGNSLDLNSMRQFIYPVMELGNNSYDRKNLFPEIQINNPPSTTHSITSTTNSPFLNQSNLINNNCIPTSESNYSKERYPLYQNIKKSFEPNSLPSNINYNDYFKNHLEKGEKSCTYAFNLKPLNITRETDDEEKKEINLKSIIKEPDKIIQKNTENEKILNSITETLKINNLMPKKLTSKLNISEFSSIESNLIKKPYKSDFFTFKKRCCLNLFTQKKQIFSRNMLSLFPDIKKQANNWNSKFFLSDTEIYLIDKSPLIENSGDNDDLSEFHFSDAPDSKENDDSRYNDMPNNFSQMLDFYKEQMEYREKLFSDEETLPKNSNIQLTVNSSAQNNYIPTSIQNLNYFPESTLYTLGQI